ncbi:hypothetical protein [Paenibacillus graminis]|uniref:Thioredoxin domain-containing protein n=1 Tax=Paenibacillus graminis TaxID=189425 RepID=A0A089M9Q1_9BACL|nr:hypothetical protein [Paenibacillus graminis]AIQ70536.1 hypothetical protein PGRAT_25045 [Paenibacillus graminis]
MSKIKPEFLSRFEVNLLQIGDELPNMPILPGLELYDLITDHLILFLVSTHCDLCEKTLESIDEYTKNHQGRNFVVLLDSDANGQQFLRNIFGNRVRLYIVPPPIMHKHLKMQFLPIGFGVDQDKMIVTTHSVQNAEMLLDLLNPLFNKIGENNEI